MPPAYDVLHTCRLALGTLGLGPKYHLGFVKPDGRMMQEVARLLSAGKLKAVIAKTFPLEEAAYVTCLLWPSVSAVSLHACISNSNLPGADTVVALCYSTLQRLPACGMAVVWLVACTLPCSCCILPIYICCLQSVVCTAGLHMNTWRQAIPVEK
jgi:hypothetical protein